MTVALGQESASHYLVLDEYTSKLYHRAAEQNTTLSVLVQQWVRPQAMIVKMNIPFGLIVYLLRSICPAS